LRIEIPPRPESNAPAFASLGHTAALVAVLLAVAITGTLLQLSGALPPPSGVRASGGSARISGQYLPLLCVNGLLASYVSRLFRPRGTLKRLLGRSWRRPEDALLDICYAGFTFALIVAVEVLTRPFFAGRNAAVSTLLPGTVAERLTWVVVALGVGFCEELVYRGYLQTQLTVFTRSAGLGLVLQAMLFGVAHLEQGPGAALRIGVYGLLLGTLARRRASLLPGIVCHVSIDLAGGLL